MPTKVPLQSVVLTSATSSVTFSGIDQTYQDLELVISGSADPAQNINLRYNGDTASNYSGNYAVGDGSTTGAGRFSSQTAGALTGAMYPGLGMCTISIPNYSNTTTYKTAIGRSSTAATLAAIYCSLWRSTAAISSITLNCTLDSGTTIDLYGVSPVNAKVASASGGTAIYYDSTYAYHVFTGTGTFTPARSLTADILVVAGGGGGGAGTNGSNGGGGGGAGGLLAFTSQSLTATNYTVTVGAGGVGNGSTGVSTNGADSQFGALTLVKGGGAGGSNYIGSANWPGLNGGSGGGGYGRLAAGGSPTSGQGYAGGTGGADSGNYSGAGGGGAGAAGANGNSGSTAGGGGVGSSTYSAWGAATSTGHNVGGTYYFAGGGAGGSYSATAASGGYGGGGNGGSSSAVATSGKTNTGGGGGASGGNSTGAGIGTNGGSGIVIVRYAR